MRKVVVTMVLLFVSLNGYAGCKLRTPEEMSYYIYMEENELQYEYCLCNTVRWAAQRAVERAENRYRAKKENEVNILSNEMDKIKRVLKRDYDTEPKEC